MKTCIKCGVEREETAFGKDKQRKDGLRAWCKPCSKEYLAAYRLKNKAKLIEQTRAYRLANAAKLRELGAAYRAKNKEAITARRRENAERYAENQKKARRAALLKNPRFHIDYYNRRKDHILAGRKVRYAENRDVYLERGRKWREENPEEATTPKVRSYLKSTGIHAEGIVKDVTDLRLIKREVKKLNELIKEIHK